MINKKALIVIDYTNDFVASDGKLTCGKPAQDIENRITEITGEFIKKNYFTVMAVDIHKENDIFHPETKLFPPHNISETDGRKLYGKLENLYNENKEQIYFMDKTRYSAFVGTDLELQLVTRGIKEIHLIGVCTDICVLHTAVDAYNKGFEIVIHKDAVQSFDSEGHKWAISHFKGTLGAKIYEKNIEI
jgi:nicotinamidase-related amidase